MFWDVKFRYGSDSAAAKLAAVEEDEAVELAGTGVLPPVAALEPCGCFGLWRWSCRALARAFSCVRTK